MRHPQNPEISSVGAEEQNAEQSCRFRAEQTACTTHLASELQSIEKTDLQMIFMFYRVDQSKKEIKAPHACRLQIHARKKGL